MFPSAATEGSLGKSIHQCLMRDSVKGDIRELYREETWETHAPYYSQLSKRILLFLVNKDSEMQTKVTPLQINHPVYTVENLFQCTYFLKAIFTHRLKDS